MAEQADTPTLLDESTALTQAKKTGKPVTVTTATTPTETLTANPSGSLTLTESVTPVRKRVGTGWKDLDATLKLGANGQITPAVANGNLSLSSGGDSPLATMAGGGASLALKLPFTLPKPTLSGPTATYADVLPGVDLQVTADTHGGFAETIVVADAKAAANPDLAQLTFDTTARGVTLAADSAGNIAGTDVNKRTIVSAPAPTMWDSSAPAAAPKATAMTKKGVKVDAATGTPITSSADGPGLGARTANLGVKVAPGRITLKPPTTMLAGKNTTWPLYIDPNWSWGADTDGWAVISQQQPQRKFWKTSASDQSDMQSGHDSETGDTRRTLLNFPVDTSRLNSTATIYSATLNITEIWAWDCTPRPVDLYGPTSAVVTPTNAFWDAWSGVDLGTRLDQAVIAHGYSGCAADGVPFDISSVIKADAKSNHKDQTLVLKANDESDTKQWKRWLASSPKITVEYDHTPNQPVNLRTSPTTKCNGSIIGWNSVKLYADVSDPDGGNVDQRFTIWKDGDTSTKTTQLVQGAVSGKASVPLTVTKAWFANYAPDKAATKFDWQLTASQNSLTSKVSATCSFTIDRARPEGTPLVEAPTDGVTVGKAVNLQITYDGTDTPPASYQYQINAGYLATSAANADGSATISVVPTRTTNHFTITGVSAGGNIAVEIGYGTFNATPASPELNGDLTGDGNVDLLTTGGSGTIPSGLWLAPGTGAPTLSLNTVATNIGANGDGVGNGGTATNDPAIFNNAQVITGHFTPTGLQDIMYYYPSTGSGGILSTFGDGSVLEPSADDGQHSILANQLCDGNPFTGCKNPLSVTDAGDTAALHTGYSDILGPVGNDTDGYHLSYWTNGGGVGRYSRAKELGLATPDGTMDWNNWTLASAVNHFGTTDLYLWNKGTGALSIWTQLGLSDDGVGDYTLTYTPYVLADGSSTFFNKESPVTLRAGDINRDGTTDLWATTSGGVATAWLFDGGSLTINSEPSQTVNTATHYWPLNDVTDQGGDGDVANEGPVGSGQARDVVAGFNGSGTGGAAYVRGDAFNPTVELPGGSARVTAPKAVATNQDFSVAAWVKPIALGGTVLSQDGSAGAEFRIWVGTDGLWRFGMQKSDAAYTGDTQFDVATSTGGYGRTNIWYHVTASYQASTRKMTLYIDDYLVGTGTHSTNWAATAGSFQMGALHTSASAYGQYFNGRISSVQTWNAVIDPRAENRIGTWNRTRDPNGVWATSGTLVDSNPAVVSSAVATLPDGSMAIFSVIPGSGIWERGRRSNGTWDLSATHVDTNGAITKVAAAGLADGTLQYIAYIPGSGIWYRQRNTAGVWDSSAQHPDTNGNLINISLNALPNGTLHEQVIATGGGVYDRIKPLNAAWATSGSLVDSNTSITDVATVGMPDGSMNLYSLLPGSGVYIRTRSAAGTWGSSSLLLANGAIATVAASSDSKGDVNITQTVPHNGVWNRTVAPDGSWTSERIDQSTGVTDIYSAITTDGSTQIGYIPDLT